MTDVENIMQIAKTVAASADREKLLTSLFDYVLLLQPNPCEPLPA
jgi:hypothetical protein